MNVFDVPVSGSQEMQRKGLGCEANCAINAFEYYARKVKEIVSVKLDRRLEELHFSVELPICGSGIEAAIIVLNGITKYGMIKCYFDSNNVVECLCKK